MDVDNFRLFNDTHGHAAADQVLLKVAALVAAEADGGHVARYGPDEFLIVRPGAGTEEIVERRRCGCAAGLEAESRPVRRFGASPDERQRRDLAPTRSTRHR